MIAQYNKLISVDDTDKFDLSFFTDDWEQMPISLGGVDFQVPYTSSEMEARATSIAGYLYPDEILTEIVTNIDGVSSSNRIG